MFYFHYINIYKLFLLCHYINIFYFINYFYYVLFSLYKYFIYIILFLHQKKDGWEELAGREERTCI